jgi:uncharacterized protein YjbI with pentapeptide repeats
MSETAQVKAFRQARSYFFVGRNYERADLRNKDLRGVNFTCANFRGADLSGSDLRGAIFVSADLSRACLHRCNCEGADFSGADLTGSYLKGANFTRATLWHTVFKGAICKNTKFHEADMTGADIARAEMLGARFDGATVTGLRNINLAIFRWFLSPFGGKPSYEPFPEAIVLTESLLGDKSLQENSGMGQSGRGYLPAEMEL